MCLDRPQSKQTTELLLGYNIDGTLTNSADLALADPVDAAPLTFLVIAGAGCPFLWAIFFTMLGGVSEMAKGVWTSCSPSTPEHGDGALDGSARDTKP
ncbi:unnamed protein product [Lampetra planeri]